MSKEVQEEQWRDLTIVKLLNVKDPVYGAENARAIEEFDAFIKKVREEAYDEGHKQGWEVGKLEAEIFAPKPSKFLGQFKGKDMYGNEATDECLKYQMKELEVLSKLCKV